MPTSDTSHTLTSNHIPLAILTNDSSALHAILRRERGRILQSITAEIEVVRSEIDICFGVVHLPASYASLPFTGVAVGDMDLAKRIAVMQPRAASASLYEYTSGTFLFAPAAHGAVAA